jgi:hypothetical protein
MNRCWSVLIFCLLVAANVNAQGRGGPPQPPPAPKAAAPEDLTGYWVSLVTEDWRYRMAMPLKGDYASVPLNPEGRKAADAWDPAKDEAAGDQCKIYGAGGIMRVPTRLHITWQDDNTLKLETDAGTQTRIFPFGAPQGQAGSWQGVSIASWDRPTSPLAGQPRGGGGPPNIGSLKVVTTQMKPGYLRKNGVPYSANATMTEYFDRFDIPGGESLLVVTTEFTDPAYLALPFWTSTHFKMQNDASGWNPAPCASR